MQPRRASGSATQGYLHRQRFMGALLVLLFSGLSGCVQISQTEGLSQQDSLPTSSAADASLGSNAEGIRVEASSAQVAPGETVIIDIRVEPEAEHQVQLRLTADSAGAFLDESQLTTDADGHTEALLSVTNEASSVTVQAVSGDVSAEITIDVSKTPTATIRVRPDYRGQRAIPSYWIALSANGDCDDPSGYWSDDAQRVDAFDDLIIENYVATTPVAVHARIENYAFGCVAGVELSPARPNVIDLLVVDRPLQLEQFELELGFGLTWTADLSAQLDALIQHMTAEFRTQGSDDAPSTDVDTLLDEMATIAGDPEQFLAWREAHGWDARLEGALTRAGAEVGLSSRVRTWLEAGAQLLTSQRAFVGRVYSAATPNKAWFELAEVQGMPPRRAGMPDLHQTNLLTSGDEVTLAFTLWLEPSSLLAALAEIPVSNDGFDSVVDALDMSIACPGDAGMGRCSLCERVGEVLFEPLAVAEDVGACDAACMSTLCVDALRARWDNVRSAHGGVASIAVAAASPAEVDSDANVTALSGTWVGETELFGTGSIPLEGPFSAVTPEEEP